MEKSSQSPATTQETQAPATPGRLDGVVIDSCVFTESVGKREPRPPLFHGLHESRGGRWMDLGAVVLAIPGARVVVCEPTLPPGCAWEEDIRVLGLVLPGAPIGPAYTGPIHDSWWPIIRKFWNP